MKHACNGEEAIQMTRECLNRCQNPFCTDKHYQLIVMDLTYKCQKWTALKQPNRYMNYIRLKS